MEEALTALLAPIAGGNRFWDRAPQKLAGPPYVILQRVTGLRDYHMKGASGLVESRVQIDCYGDTYTAAKHLARDVQALLSGHVDERFKAILIDSERDLSDDDAAGANRLFRVSTDFVIWHRE